MFAIVTPAGLERGFHALPSMNAASAFMTAMYLPHAATLMALLLVSAIAATLALGLPAPMSMNARRGCIIAMLKPCAQIPWLPLHACAMMGGQVLV